MKQYNGGVAETWSGNKGLVLCHEGLCQSGQRTRYSEVQVTWIVRMMSANVERELESSRSIGLQSLRLSFAAYIA